MLQVTFPTQPTYPLPNYLSVCFSPEPTKSNFDGEKNPKNKTKQNNKKIKNNPPPKKKQTIWKTVVITS